MKRWFESSISFACTACGRCCKSKSTRVFVNPSEIEELAACKTITLSDFVKSYTNTMTDESGKVLVSLKSHATKDQCVFLEGNTCSVYNARPTQCRTYPFWPQHMIGAAEWKSESKNCEGIDLIRHEAAEADSMFESEEIALNMIVHEIHDRGNGANWTYDSAMEILIDTIEAGEDPIEEYLDHFFDANESRIGK